MSLAEAMSGSGFLPEKMTTLAFSSATRPTEGKLDRFALVKREVSRNLHLNDLDQDMNLFNAL